MAYQLLTLGTSFPSLLRWWLFTSSSSGGHLPCDEEGHPDPGGRQGGAGHLEGLPHREQGRRSARSYPGSLYRFLLLWTPLMRTVLQLLHPFCASHLTPSSARASPRALRRLLHPHPGQELRALHGRQAARPRLSQAPGGETEWGRIGSQRPDTELRADTQAVTDTEQTAGDSEDRRPT